MAKTIIDHINAVDHSGYAEPFVGMGGVFLRREFKPKTEVINDLSGDVANLFRILQRHYPQFMDCLKYQITSRREHERLIQTNPETLTDLERAARFLYLQKTSFGAKVSGKNFGVDKAGGGRFNLNRLGPILEDVHERMAGVVIEQLPWQQLIDRYDRPGMLFYLDPPYWGNETDYGKDMFDRIQFGEMADRLGALQGSFILSINDKPEVRAVFSSFHQTVVDCQYTIAKGNAKAVKELIIESHNQA